MGSSKAGVARLGRPTRVEGHGGGGDSDPFATAGHAVAFGQVRTVRHHAMASVILYRRESGGVTENGSVKERFHTQPDTTPRPLGSVTWRKFQFRVAQLRAVEP